MSISADRHVDIKFLAVLDESIRIMRVARMIDHAAVRLEHIIDRLVVQRDIVDARNRILRQLHRPIKRLERRDLDVADRD